jgi:PST family polysaccharide transporter
MPKRLSSDQYFQMDHLVGSIGERTARGGLVTFVSHGLKFGISIVATAILARLLSPQDYGLIGMVAVVTNFVGMFKDMGLSLATVQRSQIRPDQISTLFWINASISTAITIVVATLAPVVAWFYGEPRLTTVTIAIAIGFAIAGLSVQHEAVLKRQMRFVALSAIALLSMTVGYVVGIFLAWNGMRYWSLVYGQLALLVTNLVGFWFVCGWRPGLPRRGTGVRSMLSFGGNVIGYSAINYFSTNADTLLIGRFWGPQQVGFYNKAGQLEGLPTDQINEPLSAVVIPALSRVADSPERYRSAYLRIMEKVILFTMPTVALLLVASDWVILLVLGPTWVQAGKILVFMAIAGLFQPILNTGGWLLASQGRAKDMLHWSMMNAPISLLSILAGLPWGAAGVAASYSLFRVLLTMPILWYFIGRKGPVKTVDFYRLIAPFTLAIGCAILICLGFRQAYSGSPLLGLVISGVIMGTVTLSMLCVTSPGRAALRDIKQSMVHFQLAR